MKSIRRSDPCRPDAGPDAEATRVLKAVQAAYTEHQLEQSPLDREVQRLAEAHVMAQFREGRADIAFKEACNFKTQACEHYIEVCGQGLQQQDDSAHRAMKEGNALVDKADRLRAAAVQDKELCHAELHFWLEAAESAGCLRDEF